MFPNQTIEKLEALGLTIPVFSYTQSGVFVHPGRRPCSGRLCQLAMPESSPPLWS